MTNDDDDDDTNKNSKVDVVIIGAGWAGLSAARQFHDQTNANINFVVLEARHEIGGRCRTAVLEDGISVAELGAQWIHNATNNNPVYKVAKEAGIAMVPSDRDSGVLYRNSTGADDGDGHRCRLVPGKQVDQKYQQWMERGFLPYQSKQQDKDPDKTLRETADKFLDSKKANAEDRAWLNYFLDAEISQEYAASLEDLSTHWWDSGHEGRERDVHVAQDCQGGYRGILEYFAKPIQNKIRCNAQVTCIDWSPSGDNCVAVNYNDKDDQQTCIIARHVLLTVPLGVLKAKTIQFVPDLPQHKQEIIDKMGVGLLNKCLFLWSDADTPHLPWPQTKEWIEIVIATPQNNNKNDNIHNNKRQHQGLWTEFFNPYPLTGRPMLCAFTAGRIASQIEESLSELEIQQQAFEALQSLFSSHIIPNPKQVVVTRWGQEEFARGSYSYNAIGAKHRYRDRLADPIGHQQLFFAGEACNSKYPSTTHGAFLSGVKAAQQILQHRDS